MCPTVHRNDLLGVPLSDGGWSKLARVGWRQPSPQQIQPRRKVPGTSTPALIVHVVCEMSGASLAKLSQSQATYVLHQAQCNFQHREISLAALTDLIQPRASCWTEGSNTLCTAGHMTPQYLPSQLNNSKFHIHRASGGSQRCQQPLSMSGQAGIGQCMQAHLAGSLRMSAMRCTLLMTASTCLMF